MIGRREFIAGAGKLLGLLVVGGGTAVATPKKWVHTMDPGENYWRCRIVCKPETSPSFTLRYSIDNGPWIDVSTARVALPERNLNIREGTCCRITNLQF